MKMLFAVLIISGIFAIYDAIRRVNNNILEQTEEIKKLHDNLREYMKK
ncbi:hypothetical protein JFL43_04930 [Viridibacillus sp. YIM B01967]|uniref:Uncharacterized protein n=1 Tax=Viridibacillus soli TaxID=2798301 RepID=A0ABS1H466_9BACL|nr:hypothetical protein [Viridibacillus soli]MBK3494209.1 hypothetical protein [Viridibacillus soli]